MFLAPGTQQTAKNLFGAKSNESSSLSFANFNLTPASTSAQSNSVSNTTNIFGSASTKPAQGIFGNNNANSGWANSGGVLTTNNSAQGIFGGASPTSNTMVAGSGKK